ncbi:MAG TPA: hypothetical protein PKY56_06580 [Candidatus Kapabacteria bacterium]|nr:hypothetical protein [Candidatus Kapabacteria bacterium]HPO63196.1 hypothetical protein [Candidatus Kapabacteria bacterium]
MKNLSLLFVLITIAFASCSDNNSTISPNDDKGSFELSAKYESIKSYPGGGGIFILNITPGVDFSGSVKIKLNTDSVLNAKLVNTVLNNANQLTEILIQPTEGAEVKNYSIEIIATHSGIEKKTSVNVELVNNVSVASYFAYTKLLEYKDWLLTKNPAYSEIFVLFNQYFLTYPETAHLYCNTFLTDNYEVRIQYPINSSYYNWSKICIRNRHFKEPEFAAIKDMENAFSEIAVSDYSIFFGY